MKTSVGKLGNVWAWFCLALPVLAFVVVDLRLRPPSPEPRGAPLESFSAERAHGYLERLLEGGAPHPTGSAEQTRVRERLVSLLGELGYRAELQRAESCGEMGVCAEVVNVTAGLPGRDTAAPTVLLTAHYDSVPSSPGAADDGSGVAAILEAARALKASPSLDRGVVFLFSDGEELGHIGARAFLARHPLAGSVGYVVNLDARGSSGPSLLFEVGSAHGTWLGQALGALHRPIASSAFTFVYQWLESGTDFSHYRERGLGGVNFAFIEDVRRYHNRTDTVQALSRGSLQHQGDNALAATRALAASSSVRDASEERVFSDVLGFGVIVLPRSIVVWLAGALLAAWLVLVASDLRRGRSTLRELGLAVSVYLGSAALAGLASFGLVAALFHWIGVPDRGSILHFRGEQLGPFTPARATFAALGYAILAGLSSLLPARFSQRAAWQAAWLPWLLAAFLLALRLPSVAFPLLLAALPVVILTLALGRLKSAPLGNSLALAWPWAVFFPTAYLIPVTLGFVALPAFSLLTCLLLGFSLSALLALSRRGRALLALGSGALALAGALAAALPTRVAWSWPLEGSAHLYSPSEKGRPRCFEARERQPGEPAPADVEVPYQWWPPYAPLVTRASSLEVLPRPELRLLESRSLPAGRRLIRLEARSRRAADSLLFFLPPRSGVRSARLNGEPVLFERLLEPRPAEDWTRVVYEGAGGRAIELELETSRSDPIRIHVVDRSFGVPAGNACARSLQTSGHVPDGEGNQLLLATEVEL